MKLFHVPVWLLVRPGPDRAGDFDCLSIACPTWSPVNYFQTHHQIRSAIIRYFHIICKDETRKCYHRCWVFCIESEIRVPRTDLWRTALVVLLCTEFSVPNLTLNYPSFRWSFTHWWNSPDITKVSNLRISNLAKRLAKIEVIHFSHPAVIQTGNQPIQETKWVWQTRPASRETMIGIV